MIKARQLLDDLQFQINEDYATKVADWLKGVPSESWDDLKKSLEIVFTSNYQSLEIELIDCKDPNMEMWAEEGKRIYVCNHIIDRYNDESLKAKLLHELSHILRHRLGKRLGVAKPNVFLSGDRKSVV